MAWTSDRVQLLTILWQKGNSASQIATELGEGVSRNAVIGKIHRLGLSHRSEGNNDKNNIRNSIRTSNKSTLGETISPDISDHTSLNAKIEKKKGRKKVEKTSNKSLKDPENLNKNEKISDIQLTKSPEHIETSELDKKALADMIELEKRAKKLNLMELTERTCKWPIGDPATDKFWFCGHQAENGKPYCSTHVAIAFQPVSTRRERRPR
ncbi:MAG: GcrA family cell cycle regulator [Paracoccaceae bacterium]|nr:GcrA family cell cycle regulator [Paracoccaceae bacterium]